MCKRFVVFSFRERLMAQCRLDKWVGWLDLTQVVEQCHVALLIFGLTACNLAISAKQSNFRNRGGASRRFVHQHQLRVAVALLFWQRLTRTCWNTVVRQR